MNMDYTIMDLEKINGIVYENSTEDEDSLSQWYKSIREKKLSQLSDGDLARLVRQGMYLEQILNECIERLYKNPFTGEKYDGELVFMIAKRIKRSFWKKNGSCKECIKDFLKFIQDNDLINNYEWLNEEDKREFSNAVKQLSNNIHE